MLVIRIYIKKQLSMNIPQLLYCKYAFLRFNLNLINYLIPLGLIPRRLRRNKLSGIIILMKGGKMIKMS